MINRLSRAERIGAVAVAAAVVASFLGWYSYVDGGTQISVNGFRASLLGDIFFAAAVLFGVLIAARAQLLHIGRIGDNVWQIVAWAALGAIGLQVVWALAVGHSLHRSVLLALVAGVAMVWTAKQHRGDRSDLAGSIH